VSQQDDHEQALLTAPNYMDRKLLTPATIARLETQFQLPAERTEIHSDLHYKSTETPKLPGA
jgi:hypothetical protein